MPCSEFTVKSRGGRNQPKHSDSRPLRSQSSDHLRRRPSEAEDFGFDGQYVRCSSQRKRVDMILQYLRIQHSWSLKDLIFAYVTAPPEEPYKQSLASRASFLFDAIFKQRPVIEALQRSQKDSDFEIESLSNTIEKELKSLEGKEYEPAFSILGLYDPFTSPDLLRLDEISEWLPQRVPILWKLFSNVVLPSRNDQLLRNNASHALQLQNRLVMLISILAYTRARKKCNLLPMIIGLHCHNLGIKRRVYDLLHHFGVVTSYTTMMRIREQLADAGKERLIHFNRFNRDEVIVVYDNFDYGEGVRTQTLHNPPKHYSVTTGKLLLGRELPKALRPNMLDCKRMLTPEDILMHEGNMQDDIQKRIHLYWIAEAIRGAHGSAVEDAFRPISDLGQVQRPARIGKGTQLEGWPQMPKLDILSPEKTEQHAFGPIPANEGTLDGTYQVLDNIFLKQLKLDDEEDFDGRLQLIYGDQKTVSLLRSIQKEQRDSMRCYDRRDWYLPIPGLFHWRMNLVDLISNVFNGSGHPNDRSGLAHHRAIIGVKLTGDSPFQDKQQVILQSFEARVLSFFYQAIKGDVDISDKEKIDNYIKNLSPDHFRAIINGIQEKAFLFECTRPDINNRNLANSGVSDADAESIAHFRFLQAVAAYKTLKYAIQRGDIGLIGRVISRCCLLFRASGTKNYAFLSLYMFNLTQTNAASEDLRRAILANSLVNLNGKETGFFEIDRLNELFNLQLKELISSRRTSSAPIIDLFYRCAAAASYNTQLKDIVESAFGVHVNNRHTDPDNSAGVRSLAYELAVPLKRGGRVAITKVFLPDDLIKSGVKKLTTSDALDKFNAEFIDGVWGEVDDDNAVNAASEPITTLLDIIDAD